VYGLENLQYDESLQHLGLPDKAIESHLVICTSQLDMLCTVVLKSAHSASRHCPHSEMSRITRLLHSAWMVCWW